MVAAAGSGTRLGPGDAKALRLVGGVPLVTHALRGLESSGCVQWGVVVAAPDLCGEFDSRLRSAGLQSKWSVVAGGPTRRESVANGLRALPTEVDVVLVHDAARAFVPPDVVRRVVAAVGTGADGAVPVVPVTDTVKQVDANGVVVATPDRAWLRQVQTPQGFRRSALDAAYASYAAAEPTGSGGSGPRVTDDAGLVEWAGGQVVAVEGDPLGFKVTGPLDLVLAEALVRARSTGH